MNKNRLICIIGAILLCYMGWTNKFPLLTPSSGHFINTGFTKEIPWAGNLMYGLFAVHASWASSLWLVIFFQAAILSVVICLFYKYFFNSDRFVLWALGFMVVVTAFTTVSASVSTLAPPVFIGIALLCGGIILFAKQMLRRDFIVVAAIFTFSCAMDPSYIMSMLIVSLLFLVYGFVKYKAGIRIIKGASLVLVFTVISWLMIASFHYLAGGRFSAVSNCQTAILPGLIRSGQFKDLVEAYPCKVKDLEVDSLLIGPLAFKDSLLTDEVKGYLEASVLLMTAERDFDTRFYGALYQNALKESVALQPDEQIALNDSIATLKSVFTYYNHEVRDVFMSRQIFKVMDIQSWGFSQMLMVLLGLISGIVLIFNRKKSKSRGFMVYLFVSWMVTAFCSTYFYGAAGLQVHLAWLWVLPLFFYIRDSSFVQKQLNEIKAFLNL